MLTDTEKLIVTMAGQMYTIMVNDVIGHGITREDDITELRAAVHIIQNMVKAQAAAREYPGEFRLLGEIVTLREE